jgi:hypothetical protein
MIRHCSMCAHKRILSRLKTYETPCMHYHWNLRSSEKQSTIYIHKTPKFFDDDLQNHAIFKSYILLTIQIKTITSPFYQDNANGQLQS